MSESPQENNKPEAEPAPEVTPEPGQEAATEAATEPASEAAAEPVAAPARPSRWRGVVLAFVVIVIVAGLVGWQWYQGRIEAGAMRQELAQKLARADEKALAGQRAASEAREAISATQGKLSVLESQLGETQAQQAALETLVRELSRDRQDWTITEIEQALIVASQRLQLSGDVAAALRALQTAEDKLKPLAQPELKGLQEAIGGDIARLQRLPTVDTAGISAQLDQLLARVDELPLAMDARPRPGARSEPGAGGERLWKELLRETWQDLKQLVRVERMDRPDVALLAPSQAFFLRENLKLRLLSARLALRMRDAQTYKADLGATRDWLRRYYDERDDAVARAIKLVSELQAAELSAEVPDIAASLEAMRSYRGGRAADKP